MKKLPEKIVSKKLILNIVFVLNLAALITVSFFHFLWIYAVVGGAFALFMIYPIASNNYVSHKLSSLLLIFVFPIYGLMLYIFTKSTSNMLFGRKKWKKLCYNSSDYVVVDEEILETLKKRNLTQFKIANYYANYFNAPLYENSTTKYISGARNYYDELFAELKNAKKYIFIDAFKIREGEVWNQLFEILKQKAREGVLIRILYNPKKNKDSFTDKLTFRKLINYKIEVMPFRSSRYGFASHRKMFVIDGVVAFVGGTNIYDKHIVATTEVGNWRQAGIKVVGDAVWSMSVLFLNSWQFVTNNKSTDYMWFKPENLKKAKSNEFIQPISISPLSSRNEVRDAYINLINNAQSSITIVSSCVIIDSKVFIALSNAVLAGVKVNLIVSNNNDKYNINILSRGHYESLIRAGVNVYEYGNGAVRSKVVSVDGETAMIGGTNLDVRKLNAQFDANILVYSKDFVKNVDKDLNDLITGCRLMEKKDLKKDPFFEKIEGKIFKFFGM